jgi:hypothetical protein
MDLAILLKDRRVVLAAGGALALVLGLGAAMLLSHRGSGGAAPPASQGGLIVETGRDDDIKLDPKRPLRCFVNGQFVGEVPLEDCAKRNGVATGALDVGLDPSGALAAASGPSAEITPLPPQPVTSLAPPGAQAAAPTQAAAPRVGDCWRYGAGSWSRLGGEMGLNACVQALYAGHCERSGAAYGRWSDQTLRLTASRVEISSDNRDFRTLVEQGPGCSVPAVG